MPHIPRAHLTPQQHIQERMLQEDNRPLKVRRKQSGGFLIKKISLKSYRPNPHALIRLFFGHGRS